MALVPNSSPLMLQVSEAFSGVVQWAEGLFGYKKKPLDTPDEHFIDASLKPQARMSAEGLDVHVLSELGRMGFRHGKEINAASHPKIYKAWQSMAKQAGLQHTPQLILAENPSINALTLGSGEVVVTTGMMQAYTRREVRSALGHELGHETSDHTLPRLLAYLGFSGAGALIGNYVGYAGGIGKLVDHAKPNPGIVRRVSAFLFDTGVKPCSLLATRIYMGIGIVLGAIIANQVSVRPTELDADHKGAIISGDPEAQISGLRKLEAQEKTHKFRSIIGYIQSGYPSINSRVKHLEKMPQIAVEEAGLAPIEKPIIPTPPPVPTIQVSGIVNDARLGTAVELQAAHS